MHGRALFYPLLFTLNMDEYLIETREIAAAKFDKHMIIEAEREWGLFNEKRASKHYLIKEEH